MVRLIQQSDRLKLLVKHFLAAITSKKYKLLISVTLSAPPVRLIFAVAGGTLAAGSILLCFATGPGEAFAAPAVGPLPAILTGTTSITHTSATTHQMHVFGDGRISNQFLNNDGQNQIDQDGMDPSATTIAILFDQHSTTSRPVDVGVQDDFLQTPPITLNTTSTVPNFDEDTRAVYSSQVLPYQIVQRTLANVNNNCVIMEFDVQNTGSFSLTGGKLLFMVDLDVALSAIGDIGVFDPDRNLLYLKDYNSEGVGGYAVGVSLVEGSLSGYGVNGNSFPQTDVEIENEMTSPSDSIIDGKNNVAWLVANIPTLTSGQSEQIGFSICAATGLTEDDADDELNETFEEIINLDAVKTSTPPPGEAIYAGQTVAYTLTFSNSGNWPLTNLILTDTLPASTTLTAYSISRGTIAATNGVVTATLDQLDPSSQPVTITLSLATSPLLQSGTVLSNKAIIQTDQLFKETNVVTHLVQSPLLSLVKSATPEPVEPGEILSYTIVAINSGQGDATGVRIFDPLPANTQFVPGSVSITLPSAGGTPGSPPVIADDITVGAGSSVTVTYAVQVDDQAQDGAIITNTASVTSTEILTPTGDTITSTVFAPSPALDIVKSGPITAQVGSSIVFTFTVTNVGNTPLDNVDIADNVASPLIRIDDGNGDNLLDLGETWIYTASYAVPLSSPDLLTNTAVVTATYLSTTVIASDTHVTLIDGFDPVLNLIKAGPATASVGETVSFTFTLSHDSTSDQSPVEKITVSDDYAGAANRISGDDGDNVLEFGETWLYTAAYTIKPDHPNPLINTATASGKDLQGISVVATDTHQTDLYSFEPVLFVTKDGPAAAVVGQTAVYTFTVLNFVEMAQLAALDLDLDLTLLATVEPGDGSPLLLTSIQDNVAGSGILVQGDTNRNSRLDGGEAWIYTASHIVSASDPNPLRNTVTVKALDPEIDQITATAQHSTEVLLKAPVKKYFYPFLGKNFTTD